MFSTLEILLPVFALIFAGFVCRRRALFDAHMASALNRFVVWLALPALLFDIMAHATRAQFDQPAFIATFSIACGIVFVLILVVRLMRGLHLADAGIDAIAAAYPNTAYLGFPLCSLVFGNSSLIPTTIATIIVVCVLFACTIVLIEIGLQNEREPHKIGWKVLKSLARNPLIVAPLAGTLVAVLHIPLGGSVETFLKLLGNAAGPCALVSLGCFLAEKRVHANAGMPRSALLLTSAKLLIQPALAWWLATYVFALPAELTGMAVVLAALPTGTGPYMLAELYRREGQVASRTILLTTLGSLVTLSLLLLYVHAGN